MTAGIIGALIALAASLFLAIRSYRSRGVSFAQSAAMVVAWIVIIAVLAFVFFRFGG